MPAAAWRRARCCAPTRGLRPLRCCPPTRAGFEGSQEDSSLKVAVGCLVSKSLTVNKDLFAHYYIGQDLHQDNVVVHVCRNEFSNGSIRSKTILSKKFSIVGPEAIAAYFKALEPYCFNQPHTAIVESTYNWYWMADGFESRGWNLRLADPSTVSRANIKYADDYTDAAYLVECLRTGSLRTTWVMPKDDRAIRDLARYRMTLVEDRARLKTIIVNMITNHLSIKLTSDKLIREIDKSVETAIESPSEEVAQQVLATYFDHRLVRIKVGSLLNRIRFLATEIGQLDQELLSLLKPNLYSKSLQTIKGCGFVTSMIIALEIGEIERFNTHKDFVSYCRLAPTSKLSNGKSKGVGNAKNGNAYLSWAFTELANLVVRFNPEAKRYYDRLFNRSRLRVKAIRSVAAKMARAIFMMLKHGETFDLKRCFGC